MQSFPNLSPSHPSSEHFLYLKNKNSKKLAIFFSGVHARNFTGYKLLQQSEINKLFIRDQKQNWYHNGVEGIARNINELSAKIKKITDEYESEQIYFFGASMGGYASLLFGSMIKTGKITVFGPQVTLNPIYPNTPQKIDYSSSPNLLQYVQEKKDLNIDIWVGSDELADLYQASLLSDMKHVKPYCVYGAPHNVMSFLNHFGSLKPLIKNVISGNQKQSSIPQIPLFDDPETLEFIKQGVPAYYSQDYSAAERNLRTLTQAQPFLGGAYILYAKCLAQQGNSQAALSQLEKGLELNSRSENTLHEMAMFHFRQKNFLEAKKYFEQEKTTTNNPKLGTFLKMIICARELSLLEEGLTIGQEAVLAHPNSYGANYQLGVILHRMGNLPDAVKHLVQALKQTQNANEIRKIRERIEKIRH